MLTDRLSDRVKHWMIFNEPLSFCGGGYLLGMHAPGIVGPSPFMAAVHHVNLCQAAAARVIRDTVPGAVVGTTHVIGPVAARGPAAIHQKAKRAMDAVTHGIFLEPNLGLGYPMEDNPVVRKVEPFLRAGDDEAVTVDFDFIGAQYYASFVAFPVPYLGGLATRQPGVKGGDRDQMGHWLNPQGLYDSVAMLHAYDRYPSIVVTENGVSLPDVVEGAGNAARVHDLRRVDYLRKHLAQVARAKADGIPVDGYFYWSFMDNFEWALGYRPRFGLVHVDFTTQQRVVKDSGHWYRAFLQA